ncbi:MAG: hypothetical protein ACRDQ6_20440 [Pseudonocardiaceae bacterium]
MPIAVIALAAVGLALALVALMPFRLRSFLARSFEHGHARMASTGERNAYLGLATDRNRFLRELRAMALIGVLLVGGLVLVVLIA